MSVYSVFHFKKILLIATKNRISLSRPGTTRDTSRNPVQNNPITLQACRYIKRLADALTSSCSEWRIRSVSAAHSFLMGVVTYSRTLTLSLRKSSCQLDLWPGMQNLFHPAGVLLLLLD